MEVKEALDGLVGQAAAKKWLLATLASGNLPQALIFAGPTGVGRRTAAKSLARYLHGIQSDVSPDTFWYSQILEEVSKEDTREWIDAMRELTRRLTLSPIASKYKVAVIDNAEKLNAEAQNALLKTLEEPREDTVIVLIVPNEEVLLPTIISRAQVVRLGPLAREEIKQIVPEASDEQIAVSGGSAGKVKDWVEMPIWWVDHKERLAFWERVEEMDVKTKLDWAAKFKERDEAVEFIRTGMLVFQNKLPDTKAALGLARMQMAVQQIRANVNLKGAVDTLLLAL